MPLLIMAVAGLMGVTVVLTYLVLYLVSVLTSSTPVFRPRRGDPR